VTSVDSAAENASDRKQSLSATAQTTAQASPQPAPPAVQRARGWTVLLLVSLALLCLLWELWLAPTGRGTLAVKALPLLLLLPGLLRHRLYSWRVLSLLVWLYVTEGLVRSTSEGGLSQWLAALEVTLALGLFAVVLHYIRLRLPPQPRGAAGASR
jgi:uncharacterized membrane protein